ncbi:MAG: M23 family metallopeptidase [Alphaproteobacteria bacterium]|nr:M23 family metallopeptidase [Alphaproteobacteria bacterium]
MTASIHSRLTRAAQVLLALLPLLVVPTLMAVASQTRAPMAAPPALPPPAEVDGFDFPVGPPDGAGYIVTQGFQDPASGRGDHLGEDWNGPGGGNSDLGTPIHVVAHGRVAMAQDLGDNGWGRVVRVVHRMPDGHEVESLYAHLDRIDVHEGDLVERGDVLGTMGDAHGRYSAHLHFELRSMARLPVGAGYGDPDGLYLDPSTFIAARRPGRVEPRRW